MLYNPENNDIRNDENIDDKTCKNQSKFSL